MINNRLGQRTIYNHVGKRGYLDYWTPQQVFRRQLVKLLEEACEAFLAAKWPAQFNHLRELVLLVRSEAGRVFDDKQFWAGLNGDIPEEVLGELADAQVVLCTAACSYEDGQQQSFNLLDTAARKSREDIERGVRK